MSDFSDDDAGIVVELITKHQSKIYAYIVSLLCRRQDSQDVLQETNMVLWRKRHEAPKSNEFVTWACRVAYYQVLAYRKRHQRDRLFFAESFLKELAGSAEGLSAQQESRIQALISCVKSLPAESAQLLRYRYASSMSIDEVSQELNRSVAAISQSLYRIRRQLLNCIHLKEQTEAQ